MWEERVTNEIWYTENFIDEKLVDEVLENIKKSDTKELDGNEQPHIISKSYYNYNHIKYNIGYDLQIRESYTNLRLAPNA